MESGCRSLLCTLLLLTVGAVHAQDQVAGPTAINLYGSPLSNFTSVICNTNDPTVGFADHTPAVPQILPIANSTFEFILGMSYNLRETPQTGYAYTYRLSVIMWGGTPITFGCGNSANINIITGMGIGTLSTVSTATTPIIGLTAGANTYNEGDVIPPVYCTAAIGAPENNAFHLNVSLADGTDLYLPRMSDPINYAVARSRHSTGTYVCTASNQFNNGVVRRLNISLIVQFQPDFTGTTLRHELNQGERLTIVCNVAAFPELTALTSTAPNNTVTDQLSKLPSTNPRLPRKVDVLIVPSVTQSSAGNYTCGAVNSVGTTTQAVQVVVIGPPSIPRNLSAANDKSSVIALSWVVPASDGGKPLTGYSATCTRANGHVVSVSVRASVLSVNISGVHAGEMYICSLTAANQAGNSSEAIVVVDVQIGPPCNPTVTQHTNSTGLRLNVNVPCDGGEPLICVLTRDPPGASVTTFSCNDLGPVVVTDTNALVGITYKYVVNVTNSQGFSTGMISSLLDSCNSSPCIDNSSTCSVTSNGSFTCSCQAGTTGDGRLPNGCMMICTDHCDDNNAVCLGNGRTRSCRCKAGYTGSGRTANSCVNIDECLLSPCQDCLATCTDTEGSFQCLCPLDFQGSGLECGGCSRGPGSELSTGAIAGASCGSFFLGSIIASLITWYLTRRGTRVEKFSVGIPMTNSDAYGMVETPTPQQQQEPQYEDVHVRPAAQ